MKKIQRIEYLMKETFIHELEKLNFFNNLKKGLFYREYNNMWQILQYHLSSGGFIEIVGFIILNKNQIDEYISGNIKRLQYSEQAVSTQPLVHVGSIYIDGSITIEKSDDEILILLQALFEKINNKLLPYLNRKTKEEIETNKPKIDLRDWIRSVDVFKYIHKISGYAAVSIKTKEELKEYRDIAIYLMYFHSKELKDKIAKIFNIPEAEIEDIINNQALYEKNESIINDFVQYHLEE